MHSVRIEIVDAEPLFNERGAAFQRARASGVRKSGKPWASDVVIPCGDGEAYPVGVYRLSASSVYPGRTVSFGPDWIAGALSFYPRLELVDDSNG